MATIENGHNSGNNNIVVGGQQHVLSTNERMQMGQSTSSISLSMSSSSDGVQVDGPMPSAVNQSNKQFGRLVGKKAARFKEIVLQNLGKADKTSDRIFDTYEQNFYKQQQNVLKLTKEFKSYLLSMRQFHMQGKNLNKCIQSASCDYQSARHDLVCENLHQLEQLNEDLLEKLGEQVMKQLGEYLSKFEELREKIQKRHRKLIDYDSSRRLYELMLAQTNKKRLRQQQQQQQQQATGIGNQAGGGGGSSGEHQDYQSILRGIKFLSQSSHSHNLQHDSFVANQLVDEARLLKLREQFNYCKLMFDTINGELHNELPAVYEKKMKSLLMALQNYYTIEAHYHANTGKLLATVSDVIDELPMSCRAQLAAYEQAAVLSEIESDPSCRNNNNNLNNGDDDEDSYESSSSQDGSSPGTTNISKVDGQLGATGGGSSSGLGSSSAGDSSTCSVDESSPSTPECEQAGKVSVLAKVNDSSVVEPADGNNCVLEDSVQEDSPLVKSAETNLNDKEEIDKKSYDVDIQSAIDLDDSSTNCEIADSVSKPSVVDEHIQELQGVGTKESYLYKVKTNYKYLAEDVDELCFEAGELIQVVEFDSNYEPEEGWLLGIRETNGQRGLFPANFTQPI